MGLALGIMVASFKFILHVGLSFQSMYSGYRSRVDTERGPSLLVTWCLLSA